MAILFCCVLFLCICMLLLSLSPPITQKVCRKWHFRAQQEKIIKKDKILTQTSFSFPFLLVTSFSDLQKNTLVPGHCSFLLVSLCSTCQQTLLPFLLLFSFPATPESVCFSFWMSEVSFQSYTLSLVHLSQTPAFRRGTNSLPSPHLSPRDFFFFVLFIPALSVSFLFVFAPAGAAS